ncbi:MAG: hypothetical protein HY735_04370 [Verrucomicrobia bacterium]|nr:hypothetical protein [Verrucomicrobiota bacterium]
MKQISHGGGWSYGSIYNDANQRTRVNLGDGSYLSYGYDSLGQVTSGKRYWSDNGPVPGQQFEYSFDSIGNRTLAKMGGDSSGGNLRQASYSGLNLRNQYGSRSIPGAVDVMGMANGSASVTVNGQGTYRKNEFYQSLVNVNNTSGGVWQGVTVSAVLEGAPETRAGNVYVGPASDGFTHDADGNLLTDGTWSNTWDGENRLTKIEAKSGVPAGAKRKGEYEYDYLGRRVAKKVYFWDSGSGSYVLGMQRRFVYDGWNVLVELDGSTNVLISP